MDVDDVNPVSESEKSRWYDNSKVIGALKRPCVGNSLIYGFGGYVVTFLATFGWTSSFRRASSYGMGTFGVVALSSSLVCTLQKVSRELESEAAYAKREAAMKEKSRALQEKIEARTKMHEERRKRQQTSADQQSGISEV